MSLMKRMHRSSYLYSGNAPLIEELYGEYLKDPGGLSPEWRGYFDELKQNGDAPESDHHAIQKSLAQQAKQRRIHTRQQTDVAIAHAEAKQVSVLQLINAYRFQGHQYADLDPLQLAARDPIADLDLETHGLGSIDTEVVFNAGSLVGVGQAPLKKILQHLKDTYCRTIGVEYMHITNTEQKRWIQERLERACATPDFGAEMKRHILGRIVAAEGLEKYLHTKYVGQKRFSLEGGESVIPALDEIVQRAGSSGIEEVVLGMTHRGRLNVLVNILGKSPADLFKEFEGFFDRKTLGGSGDVKYHQGFSSDIRTAGGVVHLALAFNPSHLEIVDPVVQGSVRARQQGRNDYSGDKVLPVLIHGDAAFAGQGVVMETFNMSQARGYKAGGTVHIIINNQIGFTTSNPLDVRSAPYCTEVSRMVQAPIFHVNGDDPEAVVFVTQIALDFRMKFKRDVLIDIVCYRRHGHSEADEPNATQPIMYKKIRNHPETTQVYARKIAGQGVVSDQELAAMALAYREALDKGEKVAYQIVTDPKKKYTFDWEPFKTYNEPLQVTTAVVADTVRELSERLTSLPEDFELHPRVAQIIEARQRMAEGKRKLDWGFTETMAYATLLAEGYSVRISGQDSGRGTFFHRHAVLHNQKDGSTCTPLAQLAGDRSHFIVIDSVLSEEAVLAYEYGYSTTSPQTLVVWEAQFGDFANNAQVVIDQFITSGEAKWGRFCGLVMFLPHGYDGQGPEHSSGRLERYLQLCAENNIQVCMPTRPAQMFHLLRRQMLRPYRKPLVIMSPKSLLRHKSSTSTLDELTEGDFLPVIGEIEEFDPTAVERMVFCSGKVYLDLLEARESAGRKDTAIVRIEELYPLPAELIRTEIARYPRIRNFVWCQEEPENQGAWRYIHYNFMTAGLLPEGNILRCAARPPSSSPAVGYFKLHLEQQKALVDKAFEI
ncbi:MAG: 2-oxoglutarate dehydrogenase E1 component [Gammaproteobacteria bacterium]|nr:MAG: 2-oxoglutarate dehydrogenase E1 component [Gammaproteobacteria bacterium]TND06821.1 MAG: 2-oxoglutarate dehydrogenase E1 component [Gammaproteobacteria bacterium]